MIVTLANVDKSTSTNQSSIEMGGYDPRHRYHHLIPEDTNQFNRLEKPILETVAKVASHTYTAPPPLKLLYNS